MLLHSFLIVVENCVSSTTVCSTGLGWAIVIVIIIVGWAGLRPPTARGGNSSTGLGWAIVIVIIIVGWAGLG